MATPSETVRRLLVDAGDDLSDEAVEQILSMKDAAVAPLVEVLLDDTLLDGGQGEPDAVSGGWAPVHAAFLLGELEATSALPALLKRLDPEVAGDELALTVADALEGFGAAAVEPLLAAYGEARRDSARFALARALCLAGVKDERIWEVLLDLLRRDPSGAATLLVLYDDPRALPLLSDLLDALPDEDPASPVEHVSCAVGQAIRDQGGALTPAQEERLARLHPEGDPARLLDDAFLEAFGKELPVHAPEHPGVSRLEPEPRQPARGHRRYAG